MMLSTGSRILSYPGRWCVLNVGGMVCISPWDGTPFLALMSVRLMASGLPPDS